MLLFVITLAVFVIVAAAIRGAYLDGFEDGERIGLIKGQMQHVRYGPFDDDDDDDDDGDEDDESYVERVRNYPCLTSRFNILNHEDGS